MAQSLPKTISVSSLDLGLYNEIKSLTEAINEPKQASADTNYTVKLSRNTKGAIEKINYYNLNGTLEKSALYNGSDLAKVKVYEKSYSYVEEEWQENKLTSENYFDVNDNLLYKVKYEYSQNKVVKVTKESGDDIFSVSYTYDEFGRVNGRTIVENGTTIAVQKYKYDVIDRITSYEDNTKKLFVWKMSANGELLSYSVVDRNDNERVINNKFDENGYNSTEISLNNIKRNVSDLKYADNIVLKRPYASEDDLILVRSLYAKK